MIEPGAALTVRELEARLRPFVARRVRSPADVDDVMQEVFLRMHRGLGALRDDRRLGPWVYRVVRSAIVDHHRASSRHRVSAPGDEDDAHDDAMLSSLEREDPAAEEALATCIAPLVAALPSPYREALTLSELEGRTQTEVAAMLEVSASGMKSRVQRGRVRLREALERCCRVALDARGRVVAFEPRAGAPGGSGCCDPSREVEGGERGEEAGRSPPPHR